MKIGMIGLGDIARKAYLPVIHGKEVELHLHARSQATLQAIGDQYRITNRHDSIESLINSGISAALVHTSTDSHERIVEMLLNSGIHVHVDKPITYNYASTARLIALAEKKSLLLNVGFNRRYAPAYVQLRQIPQPNMIVMQKNRRSLPGEIRKFVFDDFIHVIDTLLSLFPFAVEQIKISGRKKDGLLFHAMIQFIAADGTTAIGIMNRDAGTVEETVEIFSPSEKRRVFNFANQEGALTSGLDWETTLHRRGFEQMMDAFLGKLRLGPPYDRSSNALLTHKICEQVVEKLEELK